MLYCTSSKSLLHESSVQIHKLSDELVYRDIYRIVIYCVLFNRDTEENLLYHIPLLSTHVSKL